MTAAPVAPDRRSFLRRRIRLLVAATIVYNIVEAVVALVAGTIASSVALIGFGLDSVIEVSSAAAVAWQFSGRDPERREQAALRVIAYSFFVLAGYVTIESVRSLLGAGDAARSPVGIALVAASVVVMPFLSFAQRRAGRELGSVSTVADSRQTLLCTYLSAAVLAGLVLNAALGWWWADPIAGLVLAVLAVREGRSAWRGDVCCAPTGSDAGQMTWVPEACTLPTAEQPLRVAEFDELFATAVRAAHRISPTELRIHLPGGDETVSAARDLVSRETGCCSFFTFDIGRSSAGTELDVRVPQSETTVLDAMQRRVEAARAGEARA